MDFLSNLIKRPNSIMLPETEPKTESSSSGSSSSTAAVLRSGPLSPNPSTLITLAMDRCSIDTDLENLFDSAAQKLDTLEQQHQDLIEKVETSEPLPDEDNQNSARDTIKQLLNDINFNLDQVTAREMEHLQAMSLELSPLAVKPSSTTINSLDQQKTMIAAMRSAAQPNAHTEQPSQKFTGLPEFDETQIPELASLDTTEMEDQVKSNGCGTKLGSTTLKPNEHDYNSDSEIYAECLSLNSGKFSADQSELEAYSSALNEVIEQQLSNAESLDNTLDAAATVQNESCEPMDVDDINETMEMLKEVLPPEDHKFLQQQFLEGAMLQQKVEEDHLKQLSPQQLPKAEGKHGQEMREEQDGLQAEAQNQQGQQDQDQKQIEEKHGQQQLLQEKVVQKAETQRLILVEETQGQQQKIEEIQLQQEEQSLEQAIQTASPAASSPLTPHQQQQLIQEQGPKASESEALHGSQVTFSLNEQLKPQSVDQAVLSPTVAPAPAAPPLLPPLPAVQAAVAAVSPSGPATADISLEQSQPQSDSAIITPVLRVPPVEQLPTSPPIPTLRQKTPEELEILKTLQAYENPIKTEKTPEKQTDAKQEEEYTQPSSVIPIATVAPQSKDFPALELNVSVSSHGNCLAPVSPSFPIKSPKESPTHFPRSPHAPVEEDEMPYLERAIHEPAEPKLSLSGVIAKSPLPIDLTVTQPSPEKIESEQELNTTIPIDKDLPLNGTFDGASQEQLETVSAMSSRHTLGVPLEASSSHRRRTFSVNTDQLNEQVVPKRNSDSQIFGQKHEDDHFNSTYGMPLEAASRDQRRTFCMDSQKTEEQGLTLKPDRKTFCMQQDASPALEATEENIMRTDMEPMDIDESIRVETGTEKSIPFVDFTSQLTNAQALSQPPAPPSPPLPAQRNLQRQQEESLEPYKRFSPPVPGQLKRPAIHSAMPTNATMVVDEQRLSVKEQLSTGDEKEDVYVEHFGAMSPISDDIFKQPQRIGSKAKGNTKASTVSSSETDDEQFYDAEFQDGATNNSSNNAPIDRSSLLLKFDPLLGAPVPVNQSSVQQQEQALLSILNTNANTNNNNNITRALSPTLEEHETSSSNHSFSIESCAKGGAVGGQKEFKPPVDRSKKHAKMSVDVIDTDCNKTFDNSSLNSEDKTHKYHNMDELEKKIKNEVTRSEDIEKKLKEAEQREEALVKRITEKDKTNAKLNGVIEAYEKAIAELISDKEQLVQNHERQMLEIQADRDSNYHHLTSLETTFSDLHVKYEKSKEMTSQLKQIEENLLEEKKKLMDKLRQQEQRYEQMKSHAMQQMEIANKKLASLTKEHTDEVKKLKALLKKEEVSRISTAEQLQQKSRENADLLKICEELIYDKGQGGSS